MSSEISLAASVSRPSGDLNLSQANVYEVVEYASGGVLWRRTAVEGKYQRGRRLLNVQAATITDSLVVRVYGTSWAQVNNRVQTLLSAFSQLEYQLTIVEAGVERTIVCEPADMSDADTSRRKALMFGDTSRSMREISFSIPRDPQLVEGAM